MKRYKTEQDFMLAFGYECGAKRKWLSQIGMHTPKDKVIEVMWKRLFDKDASTADLQYIFNKLSPEDQVMLKLLKGG